MAAMNAIPLDIPEIKELKAERVKKLIEGLTGLLRRFDLAPLDDMQISVIGPALISTILSHFRFKSVQKDVFNFKFDEAFYERYVETIATLFLHGIDGFASTNRWLKGERSE